MTVVSNKFLSVKKRLFSGPRSRRFKVIRVISVLFLFAYYLILRENPTGALMLMFIAGSMLGFLR
jgi:hypothetical protein